MVNTFGLVRLPSNGVEQLNPIQPADILGQSSLVMIHKVYAHLSPVDACDAMVCTLVAEDWSLLTA
jgi:hypothetical protein